MPSNNASQRQEQPFSPKADIANNSVDTGGGNFNVDHLLGRPTPSHDTSGAERPMTAAEAAKATRDALVHEAVKLESAAAHEQETGTISGIASAVALGASTAVGLLARRNPALLFSSACGVASGTLFGLNALDSHAEARDKNRAAESLESTIRNMKYQPPAPGHRPDRTEA